MIGDDKELVHLVAKQFCENKELFTVVEASLQKLGYSIISNENLKQLIINNIEQ
jgi:flagellar biosynthesis/type III secretory pathway chaperone